MDTQGKRLKSARQSAGLRIRDIATLTGATTRDVLRWECDQLLPSHDQASELTLKLGIIVEHTDLLGDEVSLSEHPDCMMMILPHQVAAQLDELVARFGLLSRDETIRRLITDAHIRMLGE